MANWNDLKAAIEEVIKINGNQEITGQVLQDTLKSIVNNIGKNATYAGVATPETNPENPDGPVFYLAYIRGAYSNFNNIELSKGIAVLYNDYENNWYSIDVNSELFDLVSDYCTISVTDNSSLSDLSIRDTAGNTICELKNGHIYTKNFKSDNIAATQLQNDNTICNYNNRENPFGTKNDTYFKDAYRRRFSSKVVPLIIIAGQSNADGRANYATASNWNTTKWLSENNYKVENYKMWNYKTKSFEDYSVTQNNGTSEDTIGLNCYSFDPFFAKAFISNRQLPLYAIRHTLGGICIGSTVYRVNKNQTWNANIGKFESTGLTNINYLVLGLLEKIKAAEAWASANGIILLPVAVLWHQGETDASNNLLDSYEDNLKQTLSFIRGSLQMPGIPILSGFIQKNYASNYGDVNMILEKVSEIDDYYKVVDMENHYTSIGDGLHYDGQALEYMGTQMFNLFNTIG